MHIKEKINFSDRVTNIFGCMLIVYQSFLLCPLAFRQPWEGWMGKVGWGRMDGEGWMGKDGWGMVDGKEGAGKNQLAAVLMH